MKYVLDASVAIKWVLPEQDSNKALAVRDDFCYQRCELIAPDTFAVEVAHALTRAERKGLLKAPEALLRVTDVLSTAPVLHPFLPILPRAVEISSQLRLGVYDCLYVALAEQQQCHLLSADVRLANALASQFAPVVHLSTLP